MKNNTLLIYLIIMLSHSIGFSFSFENGDFESVSCQTNCINPATLSMDCVDDWFPYIVNGYLPLQFNGCNNHHVCEGNYSIRLDEGSGSNSVSVMTANPYFGMELNGIHQIINLDSRVLIDNSFGNSGIAISGTNVDPANVPDLNSFLLGERKATQEGVCESMSIVVSPQISDFQYLIFGKRSHTDGETTIIDNVNTDCGGLISITQECTNVKIKFSDCISNYDIVDILIKIDDSNGDNVVNSIVTTMDDFIIDLPGIGEYDLVVDIIYNTIGFTPVEKYFYVETTIKVSEEDCCSTINADFDYGFDNGGSSTSSIIVNNFNTYQSLGAIHKWYVFSSPNENGGPYTLVNTEISTVETYVLLGSAAEIDLNYTIIHKVIIDECGSACESKEINSGEIIGETTAKTRSEESICDLLDDLVSDCDDLAAPINLRAEGNTLIWDPVVGATGYNLWVLPNNTSPFCYCISDIGNAPINVIIPLLDDQTSFSIPAQYANFCFKWRVQTKCGLGNSPYSETQCYAGTGGSNEDSFAVGIYPNPNNGVMQIDINKNDDSKILLDIYRFNGSLVKSISNIKTINGVANIMLDESHTLNSGLYFFKFKTNKESITRKVFVQ